MNIVRASPEDLDALADLFDAYRVSYDQPSNRPAARAFLAERLARDESLIFVALDRGLVGFAQLYPGFSSISLGRIWILNDLFVAPDRRDHGIGRALVHRCIEHARQTRAVKIVLETAPDNGAARAIYASFGFQVEHWLDTHVLHLKPA